MMNKERKAKEITSLSERFGKSKAAFLVDFKGLNVEEVTGLRKALVPISSEMKVVRNTLALRALQDHPDMSAALSGSLVGTNAVVFAYSDVTATAKALSNYAKDVEELQIKIGVMDGKGLNEKEILFLATLPGKDELRAQLLGVLSAPMSKFLGTLQAVPASFVRVLAARKDSEKS